MEPARALLLGDDPSVRSVLRAALERRGVPVAEAADGDQAARLLDDGSVRLMFLDPEVAGAAGAKLLERAVDRPSSVTVVLDGGCEPAAALDRMRRGVFDVIRPPADALSASALVQRSLTQLELLAEVERLRDEVAGRNAPGLVGDSEAMQRVRQRLERLAAGDRRVWLHGEARTGKQLAARILHQRSSRAARPFVVLDASNEGDGRTAAGPDWAELGRRASGGTLLVAQPAALDLRQQECCLRELPGALLANGVRLLVASVDPPAALVAAGRLAEGWSELVGGERLALPPLRERKEDVVPLARQFIATICQLNQLPPVDLGADVAPVLENYHWPGNVDELRQVIERAMLVASDGVIRAEDVSLRETLQARTPQAATATESVSAARPFREAKKEVVERFERAYLHDLLGRHMGNVTAASQHAGMLRSALQRLLRKYHLRSAEYRRRAVAEPARAAAPRPGAG